MGNYDFISLDVETANPYLYSICQLGIAAFKDGHQVATAKTYIDPEDYFDDMNVMIHGITAEDVKNAPAFNQVYDSLREKFDGNIVVHHTAFDRSSFNQAAMRYNLPPVEFRWLDSARVARRAWEECRYFGYGLEPLAEKFGITFVHHDALEDARAAGEILLKAIADTGIPLSEWVTKAYKPINQIQRIEHAGNPDGPFFGEVIVFTGALNRLRSVAAEAASEAGCEVKDDVTVKTTLLVVGTQDNRKLAGKDKSSKHIKAEKLISKGIKIRILSESDFYELVKIA